MDLPNLPCPTYSNASLAEEACDGIFLMWGQFFNETTRIRQSSFIDLATDEERVAQVGPYYCSTCNNGIEGHGYVSPDGVLPEVVDDGHVDENGFTYCPVQMFDTLEDTSCAGSQQYCESNGHGWLLYAKSFYNYHGNIRCSSGCSLSASGFFGSETEFGEQIIAVPSHLADLRTWPMFFMWAMVLFMFVAATYIDFRLFKGVRKEWFSHYLFSLLGYVGLDGKQNRFRDQVCMNPCPCRCCECCKICTDKDDEMFAVRIAFLSLLILALGVALLFGDGEAYDQICYFNALPPSDDETTYDLALPHAFHEAIFGQHGPVSVLDSEPSIRIFDREWFVSELAIVMYQMAQELLAYNLVKADYLSRKAALFAMPVNSAIFLVCCWSVVNQEDIIWAILWEYWFIGFILAIMFNPIFNAISFGVASLIAKCGCLPDPIKKPADSSSGGKVDGSMSTSHVDSKQLFKVAIPQGMQPGEQLKVHIGVASNSSPLVTIPAQELWHSEPLVAPNGQVSTQQFFYVAETAGASTANNASNSTLPTVNNGSSSTISMINPGCSPPSSPRTSGRRPSGGLQSRISGTRQGGLLPTNGAPVQFGSA